MIFRGLIRVVEFLLVILIVRIVLRGLAGMFAAAAPARRQAPPSSPPRVIEDLVRDPVCNTFVPRSRALAARVDGRETLFCSAACRDRALAAVARAS